MATTRVTSGGGLRGRWGLQQTLVASEVALALIVLVGAALMTRSFRAQLGIEPGFDPAGVVLARVQLPQAGYDAEARRTFVDRLLAEMHATPGTSAAAVVSSAPLRGFNSAAILQRDGHDDDRIRYYRHSVTPEYFSALRIPITRGRVFTVADAPGSEPVVIVGEETANRFWPGADPIGRRIRLGRGPDAPVANVIGVAGNVRMRGLTTSPSDPGDDPDVYFPYAQRPAPAFDILVRSAADETGAFTRIRAAVAQLDPNLAMYGMEPLDAAVAAQTASDRFGSTLLILFGALALTLAAVGVYGVMAFYVGTHAREIAIRMAIGAAPGHVQRFVLGRGLIIATAGIVAGTAGALLASDYLATLLFGISATDPLTYGVIAFVLLAVAAAANTVPVLRATRIPPQVTLRSD